MLNLWNLTLITVFSPLIGSMIAGFLGKKIGKKITHFVTIAGVLISLICSLAMLYVLPNSGILNQNFYTWAKIANYSFYIGFLIDNLTVIMLCVVTFVSLMVHIYSIEYMKDDDGYQRFFAYMSLFTFSMLMLVTSNNCLQLFFGWEAVGLVSYLLIGFWYQKESAVFANLKAFLVNRVGDFGFLIGIAALLLMCNTLDYYEIFKSDFTKTQYINILGNNVNLLTVGCVGLFIGAMGKSAQIPLHVWLPDSMEGPTPISALIHAATMVTAGIFMVARMSPVFEYSEFTLNLILMIGAMTAFFMGILGLIQNDIKRIVAYSTLSQLGYMVTALGVSAYSIAIFHLFTHAFFKALLFLGSGSVIIAMHHEQDIRKMGNIRKYMPITFATMMIGSLALAGMPFLSGFYSKDMIIMAVQKSNLPSSGFAYFAVLTSVFVTTLYSFRLLFLVFFTKERMSEHEKSHLHECPKVVTVPLIMLAIPSIFIGFLTIDSFMNADLGGAIFVKDKTMNGLTEEFHGALALGLHGFITLPFLLFVLGIATAWVMYIRFTDIPQKIEEKLWPIKKVLSVKYGFDIAYQIFFAGGARLVGWFLWKFSDQFLIDDMIVNGSAKTVKTTSFSLRNVQTGYIYHYVCIMVIGVLLIVTWLLRS